MTRSNCWANSLGLASLLVHATAALLSIHDLIWIMRLASASSGPQSMVARNTLKNSRTFILKSLFPLRFSCKRFWCTSELAPLILTFICSVKSGLERELARELISAIAARSAASNST